MKKDRTVQSMCIVYGTIILVTYVVVEAMGHGVDPRDWCFWTYNTIKHL